jgi:hypothetical protein
MKLVINSLVLELTIKTLTMLKFPPNLSARIRMRLYLISFSFALGALESGLLHQPELA